MHKFVSFAVAVSLMAGFPGLPKTKKPEDRLFVLGKGTTGDIRAQTRESAASLAAALNSAGMDLTDIVSVTVHLSDSRNLSSMEDVYRGYFKKSPPVRSVVISELVEAGSLIQVSAIAAARELRRTIIRPAGSAGHFESSGYAIRAGDYLFLPGLMAPGGEPDIKLQTRKVLDSAKTLVESDGFNMSDLTESRVWLTDRNDFQGMNEIYRTYFAGIPPTRAALHAHLSSPESRIQVMMWGIKGARQRLGNSVPVPLSQAIKAGNYLFISGIIPSGGALRGDITDQTRDVLQQISGLLKQGGMDFSDVVDSEVFLSDARNFAPMSQVYREIVKDKPARSTVEVLMSADMLVEIAMVARRRGQ